MVQIVIECSGLQCCKKNLNSVVQRQKKRIKKTKTKKLHAEKITKKKKTSLKIYSVCFRNNALFLQVAIWKTGSFKGTNHNSYSSYSYYKSTVE